MENQHLEHLCFEKKQQRDLWRRSWKVDDGGYCVEDVDGVQSVVVGV